MAVEQVLVPTVLAAGGWGEDPDDRDGPRRADRSGCHLQPPLCGRRWLLGVRRHGGYEAPGWVFVPFTGAQPRVYDSRTSAGKLAAGNEERIVPLGLAGARHGVFNLTLDATEGAGFVAAFAANVVYPGTSSINWSTTNQIIANTVIANVDSLGQIKIRGGANKTHVVIDMIGYLI